MNWDRIQGNRKQAKGKAWGRGRLTDDHLDIIDGRPERFLGQIEESCGIARDEAKNQVQDREKRNKAAFDDGENRVSR